MQFPRWNNVMLKIVSPYPCERTKPKRIVIHQNNRHSRLGCAATSCCQHLLKSRSIECTLTHPDVNVITIDNASWSVEKWKITSGVAPKNISNSMRSSCCAFFFSLSRRNNYFVDCWRCEIVKISNAFRPLHFNSKWFHLHISHCQKVFPARIECSMLHRGIESVSFKMFQNYAFFDDFGCFEPNQISIAEIKTHKTMCPIRGVSGRFQLPRMNYYLQIQFLIYYLR